VTRTDFSRAERAALADLLDQAGPDATTLCAGWTTRDLAAHLVVRESRPDAAVGIVVGPLSGWTDRVQQGAARRPYADLVEAVRTGPPTLSLFNLPGVDSAANFLEYLVHHEDVRRGEPGWEPRDLDPAEADAIWARLGKMGKMFFRRVPVGVDLVRTDGAGGTLRVREGEPVVTLRGPALELLLRTYGRTEVLVDVEGDPQDVARFSRAKLGV
jgi:uncharacterized protein (TIGR03085 family)